MIYIKESPLIGIIGPKRTRGEQGGLCLIQLVPQRVNTCLEPNESLLYVCQVYSEI